MEFTKLSAPTLKQLFIEQLEKMILSGKLPIGAKLPPERELAASMQISRSVVNAGIAEMADCGFLEIIPRSGTYVADYRRKGTLDTLVSIMKFNGGTLPDADIRSILEIRLVLFRLALELAMPKITDEGIETLEECAARIDAASTPEDGANTLFEFDHILCCLSGNTLLPLIFYSFRSPDVMLYERYFRLHGYESMRVRTHAICEAMRQRDLEAAVSIITNSIEETLSGSTTLYNA